MPFHDFPQVAYCEPAAAPSGSQELRINAAMILEEGDVIWRCSMVRLCRVFGGRDWIGRFDFPIGDKRGKHERAVALCFAADVMEAP